VNIDQDSVPTTVDDAIEALMKALTPQDREFILNHDAVTSHFGFNMAMRNNWSVWDVQTPLVQDFIKRFKLFGHGDDVYGIINRGFWAKVRNQDPQQAMAEEAENYRQHWTRAGLNPETGKHE
jgi:uncharacterized protein DUF6794